jgi:hypothetical protein
MEDNLFILVNGRRPSKLKTNSFKEQYRTVKSGTPTNTTTKRIFAQLK